MLASLEATLVAAALVPPGPPLDALRPDVLLCLCHALPLRAVGPLARTCRETHAILTSDEAWAPVAEAQGVTPAGRSAWRGSVMRLCAFYELVHEPLERGSPALCKLYCLSFLDPASGTPPPSPRCGQTLLQSNGRWRAIVGNFFFA